MLTSQRMICDKRKRLETKGWKIGEAMSAANARLFRSGMSIQEIAAKTHMPEETVNSDIASVYA
jgi:hypothetical protein